VHRCDFIENAVNETDPAKIPGAEGVGLKKALKGYAKWGKEYYFPGFCQENYGYYGGGLNTECFDTYNASNTIFTDHTLSNTVFRQWVWMTCNEPFGYWQNGAPPGHPTLVSRLVDSEYWVRQWWVSSFSDPREDGWSDGSHLYFPEGPHGETFGLNKGATYKDVNDYTGGWFITDVPRLQYTNGDYDPWRDLSVSSDIRPGGPLQSTEQTPVLIVPGGFHVSDMVTQNGVVNDAVQAVIDQEVKQLVEWVGEWPGSENGRRLKWRA
jgi:hypothetical protein